MNTALPASYFETNQNSKAGIEMCLLPYGTASNIHQKELCSTGKVVPKKPVASIVDRRCTTEAHILSFLC